MGIFFTKSHEWIQFDNEKNEVKIGLTFYALDELGKITFLEFKKEERSSITQGEVLIVIESVKIVSEICSPFNGKILKNNLELENHLEDFSDKTWLITLTISKENPINFLKSHFMSEKAYKIFLGKSN